MGRHQGSRGRRAVVLTRVATVVGLVCATGIAVAVPAMAASDVVDGTVCTTSARACVDLVSQKAWLIDKNGNVTRGPMPITSGGMGKETPVGTFNVQWKDKTHKSQEFRTPQGLPAPMPWSVFWANGGIAFHGGSLARASAGCVHLADADAEFFYNTLQLGDEVQVHAGRDVPAPANNGDDAQPTGHRDGRPAGGDQGRRTDQGDSAGRAAAGDPAAGDPAATDPAANRPAGGAANGAGARPGAAGGPAASNPAGGAGSAQNNAGSAQNNAGSAQNNAGSAENNASSAENNGAGADKPRSARDRQPSSDSRADPDHGVDLNRSPVGRGPLPHGL